MRDRPDRISYIIDSKNRIIELSLGWEDFAAENVAGELQPDCVMGRDVWEFISGSEARNLYQACTQ